MTQRGEFVRWFVGVIVVVLFLCSPPEARAGRSAQSFPVEARAISRASAGNGPKSLNMSVVVQMVNLSNASQRVTLRLLDEGLKATMYVRNINASVVNWLRVFPTQPHTWISTRFDPDPAQRVRTFTLAANADRREVFSAQCGLKLTGLDCSVTTVQNSCLANEFSYADPAPGTDSCPVTSTANQECATALTYEGRLKIEIEEDRGAVMANFRVIPGICNGTDQVTEVINFAMNAGRPF